MSLGDWLDELFAFATGNLGWSPAEAYAATLPELILARRGRRDFLQSLFGKPKGKGGRDEAPTWRKAEVGSLTAALLRMKG